MKVVFAHKKHEVGDVYSLFFKAEKSMSWRAGEYINYTLPDTAPAGAERLFTIASAPHEELLQLTTLRGVSDFKNKLFALQPSDEVEIDQQGGDFSWEDDGRDKLYLAGGIGITPFRSIILDRAHHNQPQDAVLMYGGKVGHRPFVGELDSVAKKDDTYKVLHYESQRIAPDTIAEKVPDYSERTIYIAGPQSFVETLGEGLVGLGVDKKQIKYDWFDGYTFE